MHLLHRIFDTDENLREIILGLSRRTSENRLKHALVLDFNPYWLAAHDAEYAGISSNYLYDAFYRGIAFAPGLLAIGQSRPYDIDFRSGAAEDLTDRAFDRRKDPSPYLLRIFARPGSGTETDFALRRQLVAAARETPIPTVVETQEEAELVVAAGDRVNSPAGSRGTIGGFLRDGAAGAVYSVTCGHVIATGTAATPAGPIGPCSFAAVPIALPAGVVCDATCPY
ncbi:MAG: hypothetical protein EOO82_02060, partial [Oxalobacteraceae bacterium]